ncbi:MAG: hypothetical protein ABF285_16045 [Pacificibacter sp.]|uniref:hypothetical protein n=1 Tax=Pacificibacter sp. TaxID=1917866 RepID=UPI00321ACFC4
MFALLKNKIKTPAERLKSGGLCRNCTVFMHREKPFHVVATLFGKGVIFELDGETATYEGRTDIELGEVVKERFMASEIRPYTEDIRIRKKTQWPSYKQTNCRSVAAFERDFIRISVSGLNSSNIIVRLESQPVQFGLAITTLCNPLNAAALGGELNKIKKSYLKWERA